MTVQCIMVQTWVAMNVRKLLRMLIRMPVELHTVVGDVGIDIELFVCLGLKPNKIQFYILHIICVSKIVELK